MRLKLPCGCSNFILDLQNCVKGVTFGKSQIGGISVNPSSSLPQLHPHTFNNRKWEAELPTSVLPANTRRWKQAHWTSQHTRKDQQQTVTQHFLSLDKTPLTHTKKKSFRRTSSVTSELCLVNRWLNQPNPPLVSRWALSVVLCFWRAGRSGTESIKPEWWMETRSEPMVSTTNWFAWQMDKNTQLLELSSLQLPNWCMLHYKKRSTILQFSRDHVLKLEPKMIRSLDQQWTIVRKEVLVLLVLDFCSLQ